MEEPTVIIRRGYKQEIFEKVFEYLSDIGFRKIKIIFLDGQIQDDIAYLCTKNGICFELIVNKFNSDEIISILKNDHLRRAIVSICFEIEKIEEKIEKIIPYCHLFQIPVYFRIKLNDDLLFVKEILKFSSYLGISQIYFSLFSTFSAIKNTSFLKISEEVIPFIEKLSVISDGKILLELYKGSPLFPCDSFESFGIDEEGFLIFCPKLSLYSQGKEKVANIIDVSLEKAISLHYKMLAEVIKWRMKAKDLIINERYPLCYWCLYQFGKLDWLERSDSDWSFGIKKAKENGIFPMF